MRAKLAADSSAQEQNALLAGLPRDEWDRISQNSQKLEMAEQAVLHDHREPMKYAYFPLTGYVALLSELSDGFRTETGEVGNEGMLGLPLVLGQSGSTTTAMVQVSGEALCIPAAAFTTQLARSPTLHRRLLGFAATFMARCAQLAACNAHHSLDARLVRCLLGLDDRAQGRTFAVTHEVLAGLLCVHRPSVSVSMSRLQRLGLIRHGTRSLAITDRRGLERASCECYRIMRDIRSNKP